MKNYYLVIIGLFICTVSFGQTSFAKRYYFPDYVIIKSKTNAPNIKMTESLSGKSEVIKRDTIHLSYIDVDSTTKIAGLNNRFTHYAQLNYPRRLKANVKFNKNKLIINPWYISNDSVRDRQYFFELKNRQQIKLHYQQLTFNTITIPLKVQFGRVNKVNYQTAISIGGFFGYSWGNTKFTFRSGLDNFQRSHEITLGGLFNVSALEFINKDGGTEKTGALALGGGVLYSYDKVSIGLSYGFEYALGYRSQEWDFNDRAWLGLMFGYSLFNK